MIYWYSFWKKEEESHIVPSSQWRNHATSWANEAECCRENKTLNNNSSNSGLSEGEYCQLKQLLSQWGWVLSCEQNPDQQLM